jgi:Cu-processing system ATP-binding protein
MITTEGIIKNFKKLRVLNNVSASFRAGQVVSLIGPNGSGKTTFIKCILGMVRPDAGKVIVNGKIISNDFEYRRNIGYMPQIGRYPDNMKIGQLFDMLINIRGNQKSGFDEELVLQFKLKDIKDKSMRTLSGGTRQKVSAALAFLFNPEILILDEPTAGLDPLSSEILKEKIIAERQKNKLILISSHILSDLDELTTHVMYLQEGQLQFIRSIQQLRQETGEQKLGKVIANVMKNDLSFQQEINHNLRKINPWDN